MPASVLPGQAGAAKASCLALWQSGARPGHHQVGVILPDPAGLREADIGHRIYLQAAVVQARQADTPWSRPPGRLSWAVGWVAVPLVGLGLVRHRQAQATGDIAAIISELRRLGLRLYGFGIKPRDALTWPSRLVRALHLRLGGVA